MNDGSENPLKAHDSGPIVFAFALAAVPLLVRSLSPGVPEAGDGVLHYQYARWCWYHPVLLLDLWAKPVFTLLASPFALLGAWGVVLFNVLCAGATAIGIGTIARGGRSRWLAPLLLLTAPVYFHTVLGGMTEVLFGAATIGVVWLLMEQRVKQALVVASFLPLMRPEWVAVIPCVVLFVLWQRAWRQLPWIMLGSAVYAVFAFIFFGDPFRFFTRDPYAGVMGYGSGPADHFVRNMDAVLGWPLIVLFVAALVAWPFIRWKSKEQRKEMTGMAMLTILPALGILIIHSYAWWKGGNGSLGLLRVLGTAIPLSVLFVLHTGHQLSIAWPMLTPALAQRRKTALISLIVVLGFFGITSLTHHVPMPIAQGVDQELLLRAGARVHELDTAGHDIVCQDPLIAYAAGLDPFDSTRTRMIWAVDKSQEGLGLGTGDLLIWDAHFSPNEGGLPLERVMSDQGMRMMEMMTPREDQQVLGGFPMEIYIFRRLPGLRSISSDTLFTLDGSERTLVTNCDTVTCTAKARGAVCFTAAEFPFTLEGLPTHGDSTLFDEIILHGALEEVPSDTSSLFVVFSENDGNKQLRYHQVGIKKKDFVLSARIPRRAAGTTNKLYLWNRSGQPLVLRSFMLTRNTLQQE
ncbi:MAG: hypothetical protein ABI599_03870 [Flavobacteriales bacterium]